MENSDTLVTILGVLFLAVIYPAWRLLEWAVVTLGDLLERMAATRRHNRRIRDARRRQAMVRHPAAQAWPARPDAADYALRQWKERER